eukprot:gene8507-11537_t
MAPLMSVDLLQRSKSIAQLGDFRNTLKNSLPLKIFEAISIGSALPSLVDILLDKISFKSSMDIPNHLHFFPIFMLMVVTGTTYLSWYDQDFMAYLYICNFGIKILTFITVILHSLSTGSIASQQKMPSIIFICPIVCVAGLNISMSYGLIYPDSAACAALQTIFVVTGMVSAIAMSVFWFYSLLRHYQTVHYLTFDEKKEMLYLVGCTAFLVGFGVVSAKSSSEWYTIDEKSLLTFCILFTFAMLFLTV